MVHTVTPSTSRLPLCEEHYRVDFAYKPDSGKVSTLRNPYAPTDKWSISYLGHAKIAKNQLHILHDVLKKNLKKGNLVLFISHQRNKTFQTEIFKGMFSTIIIILCKSVVLERKRILTLCASIITGSPWDFAGCCVEVKLSF